MPLFYYILYTKIILNRIEMVVELKYIIEQLNGLLNFDNEELCDELSVCAVVDDENNIVRWCIVSKDENGNIYPITEMYNNLRELVLNRTPKKCHMEFIDREGEGLLTSSVDDLMKKRNEEIKRVKKYKNK